MDEKHGQHFELFLLLFGGGGGGGNRQYNSFLQSEANLRNIFISY